MFVNYASNMICIRINNCNIFKKQREFLHGLDHLQKLVFVGAICRFIFSFFANQNFKAVLLRKWIALVLLVKANVLVSENSIVVIIAVIKQPSAERYLANIFLPVFLWIFRKFLQRIKKNVPKIFRKFTKNTRGEVLL